MVIFQLSGKVFSIILVIIKFTIFCKDPPPQHCQQQPPVFLTMNGQPWRNSNKRFFFNWDFWVMCRNHFLNLYTLPLICYNILKMASVEVKLVSSLSQTRIQVAVFSTDFSVCVYVCPAFLVCGSSLSGNRPCMRVCQAFILRNIQL